MKKEIIVIAEAGINHNGNLKTAKKLIKVAAEAGVDIVKFQTFIADKLATKFAKKALYQKNLSNSQQSQYQMLKSLELSKKNHYELIDYCKKMKVEFLSTAFDIESIAFLNKLKLKRFKIPSGEITNFPYLKYIGQFNKPIIMSTGMSTLKEIRKALSILTNSGTERKKITLLHCNTEYPTPKKDVNLKAMLTLKKIFKVNVGYSDHTLGIEVPIAATALGATIIEKHFTLSRDQIGCDHFMSLEPRELNDMVKSVRNIEIAMGNGVKKVSLSEKKNIKIVRKSIVAKNKIKKGDIFSNKNITTKRPGSGLSPMSWNKILGRRSKRNYKVDELIK